MPYRKCEQSCELYDIPTSQIMVYLQVWYSLYRQAATTYQTTFPPLRQGGEEGGERRMVEMKGYEPAIGPSSVFC